MSLISESLAKIRARTGGAQASPSSVPGDISVPQEWQPSAEPGSRTQMPPTGTKYDAPFHPTEVMGTSETRFKNLGKIPYIRGQFASQPGSPDALVQPTRDVSSELRARLRANPDNEIDHIIPVWLGGTSQPENLRPIPKQANQAGALTKAQTAIRVLYRNPELSKKYFGRELSLAEARRFAVRAADLTDADTANLPDVNKGGFDDETSPKAVKNAAKFLSNWEKGKIQSLGYQTPWQKIKTAFSATVGTLASTDTSKTVWKGVSEAVTRGMNEGEENLAKIPGIGKPLAAVADKTNELLKGAASAITLGHFVPTPDPDETSADRAARFVGELGGGALQLYAGGALLEAKLLAGARKIPAVAKLFPEAASLAAGTGIKGRLMSAMRRFPQTALLMGVNGQLSRQEENTVEARAKNFAKMMELSAPLAFFKPGLLQASTNNRNLATKAFSSIKKGQMAELAGLFMSVQAIEAANGVPPTDATISALTFALFHGMGGAEAEGMRQHAQKEITRKQGERTVQDAVNRVANSADDPTLTPEQRDMARYHEILTATARENEKLPPEERAAKQVADAVEIMRLQSDEPDRFSGSSIQARKDAALVAVSPAVRPEPGEPAASGRLHDNEFVRAQVDRAVSDGALVTAGGQLVPGKNARTVVTPRKDGLGSEVTLVKDGVTYPLGTSPDEGLASYVESAPGTSVEGVLQVGEDGIPTVTVAESQVTNSDRVFGKKEKELLLPEGASTKVVRDEGTQTYMPAEVLTPEKESAARKRRDVLRGTKPVSQDAIKQAFLMGDFANGKATEPVIHSMTDSQLEAALIDADHTATGSKLRDVRRQSELVIREIEERLERKYADNPQAAMDEMDAVFERVKNAVSGRKATVDPAVADAAKEVTSELGIPSGPGADEAAVRLVLARRMAGTEPMPEKPALPKGSMQFGRDAYLKRQQAQAEPEAPASTLSDKEKYSLNVSEQRIARGQEPLSDYQRLKKAVTKPKKAPAKKKEAAPEPKKEISSFAKASQEIAAEIENALKLNKKEESKIASEESPEDVEKESKVNARNAAMRVVEEIRRFVNRREHRYRYDDSGNLIAVPGKVSPTDLPGYRDLTNKDVANLAQHAEELVESKFRSVREAEGQKYESERDVIIDREGRTVSLPFKRYELDTPDMTSAKDFFSENVRDGKIDNTTESWKAVESAIVYNDWEPLMRDKFLSFMSEISPIVRDERTGRMMSEWDIMDREYWMEVAGGRIPDTKKNYRDWARAWVAGQAPDVKKVNVSSPREMQDYREFWKSQNPKEAGESQEAYDNRVQDAMEAARKAGDVVMPENQWIFRNDLIQERLRTLPQGDFQSKLREQGGGRKLSETKLGKSKDKSRWDYKYDRPDGTKGDITNSVARSLKEAELGARAAGNEDMAEAWKKVQENLAELHGGETPERWYESQAPEGVVMSRLSGTANMTPATAEVIKRLNTGTFAEAVNSPDATVAEIARIAMDRSGGDPDNLYWTQEPSSRLRFGGKKVNVRDIAAFVEGRDTPDAKYLYSLAENDSDRAAIDAWLHTGKKQVGYLTDEQVEQLGNFDPESSEFSEFTAVDEKALAESGLEGGGFGVSGQGERQEYTISDLIFGGMDDPAIKEQFDALPAAKKKEAIDKMADSVSRSLDEEYEKATSEQAAERERETAAKAEREKAKEDEFARLEKEEAKANAVLNSTTRPPTAEQVSEAEATLSRVRKEKRKLRGQQPYMAPDMEVYPKGVVEEGATGRTGPEAPPASSGKPVVDQISDQFNDIVNDERVAPETKADRMRRLSGLLATLRKERASYPNDSTYQRLKRTMEKKIEDVKKE